MERVPRSRDVRDLGFFGRGFLFAWSVALARRLCLPLAAGGLDRCSLRVFEVNKALLLRGIERGPALDSKQLLGGVYIS